MLIIRFLSLLLISIALIVTISCQREGEETRHESGEMIETEETPETAEEPSQQFSKDQTCDVIRNGVHLVLAFDQASSSFKGTVENVTHYSVSAVRVEVHLSNGTELGPTPPVKLAEGQKEIINIPARGQSFDWWKVHSESGKDGQEHSGEHEGKHVEEHGGEH